MTEQRKPMPFEPEWYRPMHPAEAATELGAGADDDDHYLPEGAAIAVLAVMAAVIAALVLAHWWAGL